MPVTLQKVTEGHCPACSTRLTPYLSEEHGGRVKCWHCGALLDPESGPRPASDTGDEPPLEATQAHRLTGSGLSDVPTHSHSGEMPPSEAQGQIDAQFPAPGAATPPHLNPPAAQETKPPPSAQADPAGEEKREDEGWHGDPAIIDQSGHVPPTDQVNPEKRDVPKPTRRSRHGE
jgi:hypothetical protein